MKRGSDVGSRQKRSSNDADELCAVRPSVQLTVTSKTCRKPAMNGARNGPKAELESGVTYHFAQGTTQPDPIGSADTITQPTSIGIRAPDCVGSTGAPPSSL